jgi:hypothetical protein
LSWTLRIDWPLRTQFAILISMGCVILKKNRCASSSVRASKLLGGKKVRAIPGNGCINRNRQDLEVDCALTLSQLRQGILMCNSKCNKRSTRSPVIRQMIRPMIQSLNLRGGNLSKKISWVKIRTLWRINEILRCQTARSSQMLVLLVGNPKDKISSPPFTLGATKKYQVLRAPVRWLKHKF